MGKIEYIGVLESLTQPKVNIIEGSHILEGIDNMNPINWILVTFPIIIAILVINIIKQKKYGMLNKEVKRQMYEKNVKKYNLNSTKKIVLFGLKRFFITFISVIVFFYAMIPIHELIHAIVGSLLGINMQIGIVPVMNIAVAIPTEPLTKVQNLLMLVAPIIILGIIPAIIGIILYPKKIKNHFVGWIIACISCLMILSASADVIAIYNICKNVPNNAILYTSGDDNYWYVPKETKK